MCSQSAWDMAVMLWRCGEDCDVGQLEAVAHVRSQRAEQNDAFSKINASSTVHAPFHDMLLSYLFYPTVCDRRHERWPHRLPNQYSLKMDANGHWEGIYAAKAPDEMSWYEPHLTTSFEWILKAAPSRSSSIIDVGGGASTLVDDLQAEGFGSLTVLDLASTAMGRSQKRLGAKAREVHWITADVTRCSLPDATFDVWHDRAVFHFLTEQADRDAYIACVSRALRPSGQLIVGTFSLDGPRNCSGLPVRRYDSVSLQQQFGSNFQLLESAIVMHSTPAGGQQEFLYCRIMHL